MKKILVGHIFAVTFLLSLDLGLPRFGGHLEVGAMMRRNGSQVEDMAS